MNLTASVRTLNIWSLVLRKSCRGTTESAFPAKVLARCPFLGDSEVDRWSVLGFFCAKLLSFSELPFGLGSLAFNVSAEIERMGFCIRSEERSRNSSYFTHLWLVGKLVPALP